jgi:hypothetical protein
MQVDKLIGGQDAIMEFALHNLGVSRAPTQSTCRRHRWRRNGLLTLNLTLTVRT